MIEHTVKIEIPIEHREPGKYSNSKNMTIRNGRTELIHEHAERELINSANNCPVGKGLNFPYLAVNTHTVQWPQQL